jgi:hypothetical protein
VSVAEIEVTRAKFAGRGLAGWTGLADSARDQRKVIYFAAYANPQLIQAARICLREKRLSSDIKEDQGPRRDNDLDTRQKKARGQSRRTRSCWRRLISSARFRESAERELKGNS